MPAPVENPNESADAVVKSAIDDLRKILQTLENSLK